MKVYLVSYIGNDDTGVIKAFTSKVKANSALSKLKKLANEGAEDDDEEAYGSVKILSQEVEEVSFKITAKEICAAIEYGASRVYK